MALAIRRTVSLGLFWQAKKILAALPSSYTGLSNLDTQNPWVAVVQLADVWSRYEPFVVQALGWLAPAAAIAWIVASGFGRALVLKRLEPGLRFRPLAMIVLQAGWLVLLGLVFWGWFRSIQWVAATHITSDGDADLVGYSIWAIFLSLGFFTLWALISWPFAVAPMLMLLEERSALSALVGELHTWPRVYQQADGDQPGDGHREACVDCAGHGVFRRAVALQR